MTERETPRNPSQAFLFVAKYLGDSHQVQRLTSHDKTISTSALNEAAKHAQRIIPVNHNAFDPQHPDARLEAAARIVRGLSRDIDPARRQAGIRLLSTLQLAPAHAETIFEKYLETAEAVLDDEQKTPPDVVSDIVAASDVLMPFFPKDKKSKDKIKKTIAAAETIVESLSEVSDKQTIAKRRAKKYQEPDRRADQLAKRYEKYNLIIDLAKDPSGYTKEEIARKAGTNRGTVWQVLSQSRNRVEQGKSEYFSPDEVLKKERKIPELTPAELAEVAIYKELVTQREAKGHSRSSAGETAARKRIAHILSKERPEGETLLPRQIADVLGVGLRVVLNDRREDRSPLRGTNTPKPILSTSQYFEEIAKSEGDTVEQPDANAEVIAEQYGLEVTLYEKYGITYQISDPPPSSLNTYLAIEE